MYIILFKDACLQVYQFKQDQSNFQEGTRIFKTEYNTRVEDISYWISIGYQSTEKIKELNW